MKALRFYVRFLPSFTAIGYVARGLPLRAFGADFTGQTWLVTGATGGIGRAVAMEAADAGANVIAVGRRSDPLEELATASGGRIAAVQADLSSIEANQNLARRYPDVNVLINNVGILEATHALTTEGFGRMYATNLLGHYALTSGLLRHGVLADGLIVNITSGGAYNAMLNLAGLDAPPESFNGFTAYASQKRAQIALADHWNHEFPRLQAYAMHPGWVRTEGVRGSLAWMDRRIGTILRTPHQGADTIMWLAAARPTLVLDAIWFDRAPRTAHAYRSTRRPLATTGGLVARLEQDLARTGAS